MLILLNSFGSKIYLSIGFPIFLPMDVQMEQGNLSSMTIKSLHQRLTADSFDPTLGLNKLMKTLMERRVFELSLD